LAGGVSAKLTTLVAWPLACWTKATAAGADGVTALDGVEAGPVPMALVAVTVKVYEVPLLSPVTVVDVAAGDTWTGDGAVVPTNGVPA